MPEDPRAHIVGLATLQALMETRSRSHNRSSLNVPDGASGLLRRLAEPLAFSPIARDQLLAVALGSAADRLERGAFMAESGSAVLELSDSTETERLAIQRDVFGAGRAPAGQAGRIANALEIRYRPECRSAHELAARLREDAALHQRLWDHPSLPCDSRTRLLMHDSVRGLLERADRLAMVLHPDQQRPSP